MIVHLENPVKAEDGTHLISALRRWGLYTKSSRSSSTMCVVQGQHRLCETLFLYSPAPRQPGMKEGRKGIKESTVKMNVRL